MYLDPFVELTLAADPSVGRQEYLTAVFEALARVFPSDSLGWNCLDVETGSVEAVGTPEVFGLGSPALRLLARLPDHPMVISYLDAPGATRPRRMSDLVSHSELKRTRTYAELLRPFHAERQFTILTQRTGSRAGSCWTFNRASTDFTDDDVALAARLQPLLVLVERTLSALGSSAPSVGDLTERETQVLRLLATGLPAKAIATRLGISNATGRKHLEHIYRKLDCGDRLTAVQVARRRGLLR